MFLVLEGLDGAGTTTQLARLGRWLEGRGHRVLLTREPTDGPVGRVIRQTLQRAEGAPGPSTLPWMFAADRADHLAREIGPALADGQVVVSDRYLHSSLAYQSQDHPLEWVFELNRRFPAPDLTVFLHVPVAVSVDRIAARGAAREMFEEEARLVAIAERYEAVLAHLEARGDRIARVDGSPDPDRVFAAVAEAVAEVL